MTPEEQWTEKLAIAVIGAAPVYLAIAGFYFGPILVPNEYRTLQYVDMRQSLISAGVGFAIGLVVATVGLALRLRALKEEKYFAPDESVDGFTGEYIELHH